MFCFVFCYYLQLFQEREGRKRLPLNAENLRWTYFWTEGKKETSVIYSNSISVRPNWLRGPLSPSRTDHGCRVRREGISPGADLHGYKRKSLSATRPFISRQTHLDRGPRPRVFQLDRPQVTIRMVIPRRSVFYMVVYLILQKPCQISFHFHLLYERHQELSCHRSQFGKIWSS